MGTRKESADIKPDREEILRIYTDFCKSFYFQTVLIPESTIKEQTSSRKDKGDT